MKLPAILDRRLTYKEVSYLLAAKEYTVRCGNVNHSRLTKHFGVSRKVGMRAVKHLKELGYLTYSHDVKEPKSLVYEVNTEIDVEPREGAKWVRTI